MGSFVKRLDLYSLFPQLPKKVTCPVCAEQGQTYWDEYSIDFENDLIDIEGTDDRMLELHYYCGECNNDSYFCFSITLTYQGIKQD